MAKPSKKPPIVTAQARILVDTWIKGVKYPCDTLIEADRSFVKALVKNGAADDNAAAIEYRKGEGASVVGVSVPDAEAVENDTSLDPGDAPSGEGDAADGSGDAAKDGDGAAA